MTALPTGRVAGRETRQRSFADCSTSRAERPHDPPGCCPHVTLWACGESACLRPWCDTPSPRPAGEDEGEGTPRGVSPIGSLLSAIVPRDHAHPLNPAFSHGRRRGRSAESFVRTCAALRTHGRSRRDGAFWQTGQLSAASASHPHSVKRVPCPHDPRVAPVALPAPWVSGKDEGTAFPHLRAGRSAAPVRPGAECLPVWGEPLDLTSDGFDADSHHFV
jgi:hypothetical protein